ncbi:hypothetical protein IC744_06910 [Microbacterium hominis]|uniref:hypothetical protein n=1 Tax=Microbacterium hominis TaxID=162426 RepID=UPI00168B44AF|nr:hypothetical protein [Microbacterium hominis]QOC26077.1 hypothetical protein IC745_01230 [Microbacterium hominis]QOC30048.1 hypothetical protein IC744_06910 [Microbacterium hominis]
MSDFKQGDVVRNRKGRIGTVVGDSGGMSVRVRYVDGSRDAWVQRQNLVLEPHPGSGARFMAVPFGVTSDVHVVIDTWERGLIVSEHSTASEARQEANRANAGFHPSSGSPS